jgi:hypothetical protein
VALVTLTVVTNETEADVLCGMLRANGIECFQRRTELAGGLTAVLASGGGMEVLVDEGDLSGAQALLDEPAPDEPA